jgi:hypothetical protein
MATRRKHALKHRRRAVRKLALVPRLATRAEDLPATSEHWPILPAALQRRAGPGAWPAMLQNRSLLYTFIVALVGLVVLMILGWMESPERVRPFVGEL